MEEVNISPYGGNYPPPPAPAPVQQRGQQPLDANGVSDDEEKGRNNGYGDYHPNGDNNDADDVHDQLPTVEEYKTEADSGGSGRRINPALFMLFVIFVVVVLAVVFASIGVVIADRRNEARGSNGGSGSDEQSPASTPRGTPLYDDDQAPATRYSDIKDSLVFAGFADMETLNTPQSPQQDAALWLSNDDAMQVDPSDTNTLRSRYALAVFYNALNGPSHSWAETNFMTGDRHACDWNAQVTGKSGREYTVGASCNDDKEVVRLFLPGVGLSGELPDELQLLPSLRSIDLSKNMIEGELPTGMAKLTNLARLRLYDNDLSGSLPSWMGTAWSASLNHLNLARNGFDGDFPTALKFMTALSTLNLDDNMFNGKLEDLKDMSNVTALFLGSNYIEGPLSDELLYGWKSLEVLDLSDMGMASPLPSNLFVQDKLTIVDLSGNDFTGTLPYIKEETSDNSPMRFLALQDNDLNGPLHEELKFLTDLQHLDLSDNGFTGDIPGQISQLSSLEYLYLSNNDELDYGPIPASIGSMSNLKDLSLKNTRRGGTIPDSFRGLKDNLVLLDLDNNRLEGQIPGFLGEFPDLQFLMLNRNMFNGSIPLKFTGLANLNLLLLDKNKIRGDANPLCSADDPNAFALPNLQHFVADCKGPTSDDGDGQPEVVSCPCCTTCCRPGDDTCNNREWKSNLDPTWQNQYVRSHFIFDDGDVVSAYAVPDGYNDDGDDDDNALADDDGALGDDDDYDASGKTFGDDDGGIGDFDYDDEFDDDEFKDDDNGEFDDVVDDEFDDEFEDDAAASQGNANNNLDNLAGSQGQGGGDAEDDEFDDEFEDDGEGEADDDEFADDEVLSGETLVPVPDDDELLGGEVPDDVANFNNGHDTTTDSNGAGDSEPDADDLANPVGEVEDDEVTDDELLVDDGGEEDFADDIVDDAVDDELEDDTVDGDGAAGNPDLGPTDDELFNNNEGVDDDAAEDDAEEDDAAEDDAAEADDDEFADDEVLSGGETVGPDDDELLSGVPDDVANFDSGHDTTTESNGVGDSEPDADDLVNPVGEFEGDDEVDDDELQEDDDTVDDGADGGGGSIISNPDLGPTDDELNLDSLAGSQGAGGGNDGAEGDDAEEEDDEFVDDDVNVDDEFIDDATT